MANFRMDNLKKELKDALEQGITFEDKMQTWDTPEDVKDVVNALERTKVVHYLKLDGNTLGVPAAEAIGKALERHPELKKALWKNMFTRRLKTEIPQALKALGNGMIVAGAQLTVLDLSDNALGPNGMVGLEELLRSPVCYTLQELLLNNCGLGIGGGRMLSKALIDCHRKSTEAGTPLKLKVFITGRNRLENDGAKAIAKIFSTIKTLEMIAMPQNSIYHEGMSALAQGIRENPNLCVLNLNDNTMTAKGAASIAEALAYTPKIREINFGDCLLKTNGAYHLAEALEENHDDLEVVDLGYNEIGPDGGIVLAAAMQKKAKLKRLNLDGNAFGSDGRERIINEMSTALNPSALDDMDEDQSDADEEEEEDDDVEDEDDETVDEEEDIYERGNDTTEEVDEDEEDYQEYNEDVSEETAYVTTQAFTTKMMNPSDFSMSNKSVTFVSTDSQQNISRSAPTAENFCLSQKPCSLEMFENLQDTDKLTTFRGIINQFNGDNYLLVLVFTTLKCAHLAKSSTEALDIAVSLYKDLIDYAVKTKQERRILNYMLKQLGLLRSEEKFVSSYDLTSCRFALRETLAKNHCASDHMKNAFTVFLDNDNVAN